MSNATTHRTNCQVCGRAPVICCCDLIERIDNHTKIICLQDQRETNNKKNTLLLAQQCLANIQTITTTQITSLPNNIGLLFPNANSQAIENCPELPSNWLVLDGSWKQCKGLFLANPVLQTLPSFHFEQAPVSQYSIRKRPREDGLATIEAIAYLLSVVESECNWPVLNKAMQGFSERWLAQVPAELRHRYDR